MQKPYIVCHMMMSLDGRIDCAMTEKIAGVSEYYETLRALDAPTTVSGRVTAELEFGTLGKFKAANATPLGKTAFSKKADYDSYECLVDSKGTLLWSKQSATSSKPLLIITSENVAVEYLKYLDEQNISWIACGKNKTDLKTAAEILANEFNVSRIAVVGGGTINAGFLAAGILDEISILLAPAIDGRGGMKAVFDGLNMDSEPYHLKLIAVKTYDDGAIWLRYTTKNK